MSRLADYLAALDAMETLCALLGDGATGPDEVALKRLWLEDEV